MILKTGFLNEDLRADFSFMAEFDAHFLRQPDTPRLSIPCRNLCVDIDVVPSR